MQTNPTSLPRTGLVLGGGGITGIAWEIGMLVGLADAGIDISKADSVLGTSAGSVVGALVTADEDLEGLYAAQLEPPVGEVAAKLGTRNALRYAAYLMAPGGGPHAKRARLGRAAARARTGDESVRIEVIRQRLGHHDWSADGRLRITAVDAETGEGVMFDKDSGVDLVLAVAASCAVPLVWPPVTINGRKYIDGGMRSAANVDRMTESDRVVVLAPIVAAFSKYGRAHNQAARLGPSVRSVVLHPDAEAKAAIGKNMLDPAQRAAAAKAGRKQAASSVEEVRAVLIRQV